MAWAELAKRQMQASRGRIVLAISGRGKESPKVGSGSSTMITIFMAVQLALGWVNARTFPVSAAALL